MAHDRLLESTQRVDLIQPEAEQIRVFIGSHRKLIVRVLIEDIATAEFGLFIETIDRLGVVSVVCFLECSVAIVYTPRYSASHLHTLLRLENLTAIKRVLNPLGRLHIGNACPNSP